MRFARSTAFVLSLASTTFAIPATAAPDKATCLNAYQSGQVHSRRGELLVAREELTVCARSPCPTALAPECVEWLADVDRRMPSIVIVVRTSEGVDMRASRVLLDGRVVANAADGKGLDVDPGEHTVRVEAAPGPDAFAPTDLHFVAAENEKGRIVQVTVIPSPRPLPEQRPPAVEIQRPPSVGTTRGPIPVASWIAGGVAVAGLASFGVFSLLGNHAYAPLEHCRPSCSNDDVQSAKTLYTVGDVSLGTAIVALGVAVVVYLVTPRPEANASAAR